MTTFPKEQLIGWAQTHKKRAEDYLAAMPNDEYGLKDLALSEIALGALTAEPQPAPELKMAELINKFYERYPLDDFKSDTERSAALGYFMAGAELQCFGEFINYADLMGDE